MLNDLGWIYTIHLNEPLGRGGRNGAWHYSGWCHRGMLEARLVRHQLGQGARMLAVARDREIGWHVGHLMLGTPADEARLKRNGHHDRRCWTCAAQEHKPHPFSDLYQVVYMPIERPIPFVIEADKLPF